MKKTQNNLRILDYIKTTWSDKKFFTSKQFNKSVCELCEMVTNRYKNNPRYVPIRTNLYWDSDDDSVACTDNNVIYINMDNDLVTGFDKNQRALAIWGFLAHELGHCLYTDFTVDKRFLTGDWDYSKILSYDAFNFYNTHKSAFISYIKEMQNILEDPFIEYKITSVYTGSFKRGINLTTSLLQSSLKKAFDKEKYDLFTLLLAQARNCLPEEMLNKYPCLIETQKVFERLYTLPEPNMTDRCNMTLDLFNAVFDDFIKDNNDLSDEEIKEIIEKMVENNQNSNTNNNENQNSSGISIPIPMPSNSTDNSNNENSSDNSNQQSSSKSSNNPSSDKKEEKSATEESADQKETSDNKNNEETKSAQDESGNKESEDNSSSNENSNSEERNSSDEQAKSNEKENTDDSGKGSENSDKKVDKTDNNSDTDSKAAEGDEKSETDTSNGADCNSDSSENSEENADKSNPEDDETSKGDNAGQSDNENSSNKEENSDINAKKDSAEKENSEASDNSNNEESNVSENNSADETDEKSSNESKIDKFERNDELPNEEPKITKSVDDSEFDHSLDFNPEDVINSVAKTLIREENANITKDFNDYEIKREITSTAYHKNVSCNIIKIKNGSKVQYEHLVSDGGLKAISKQAQNKVRDDVLQKKRSLTQKRQPVGNRLDINAYAKRRKSDDFNIFINSKKPSKEPLMAVSVIVDGSGSMDSNDKIEYAKLASIILEDFCRNLKIPFNLISHDESQGKVTIREFIDFDGNKNNRYNLTKLSAGNCNRDGFPIRYAMNKIKYRKETFKLIIVISDGLPNATGYGFNQALDDIADIRKDCKKKGIDLIAFAIDKGIEKLKELYGEDNLVDCRDLKKFPKNISRILAEKSAKVYK